MKQIVKLIKWTSNKLGYKIVMVKVKPGDITIDGNVELLKYVDVVGNCRHRFLRYSQFVVGHAQLIDGRVDFLFVYKTVEAFAYLILGIVRHALLNLDTRQRHRGSI